MENSKKFLLSWRHTPEFSNFELYSPFWISERNTSHLKQFTVVAAMKAKDEYQIMRTIYGCYDVMPQKIEFIFIEERPDDWTPFSPNFPQLDWMQW